MTITYYVVQSFEMGNKGFLIPNDPQEATSERAARGMAFRLSLFKAGALAFSRTGDPDLGDWQDAVILAQHGLIPADLTDATVAA
jgi:hypothetical protein